jgi:Domain of unknown function (DUF6438)
MMRPAALVWLAVLAACSSRPAAVGGPATPYDRDAQSAGARPVITLERRPCFGTCPVYQVAIARSGAVSYTGKHHVTTQGAATAQLPAERVDSLLDALERGGYFEFADDYVMNTPACGMYATDSPTVVTTVTARGRTKTIRHDYGCTGAPRELARLERLIDDVVGTDRWTGRE